jgi:4-hydroxy-4-methyl-2-oxoglutarate aldolase
MANHQIVRRGEPVDPSFLLALRDGGVATVHESMGRSGLLDLAIRPIQSGTAIAGTAVTVLTESDDDLMIHAAVEQCGPGDVLVVAVTAESSYGLIGELLATALARRGVAGLIIDAGVRDTAELREMGFPVWSRVISSQGATKGKAGSVNVLVSCAGREIRPGDAIVADDDGVVCVPRAEVPDVAARTRERLAGEMEKRAVFAAGELSLDLYGLRETLDDLGVVTVDCAEPDEVG